LAATYYTDFHLKSLFSVGGETKQLGAARSAGSGVYRGK
jgi:hypothetical protein